jgi:hypothetical protein
MMTPIAVGLLAATLVAIDGPDVAAAQICPDSTLGSSDDG